MVFDAGLGTLVLSVGQTIGAFDGGTRGTALFDAEIVVSGAGDLSAAPTALQCQLSKGHAGRYAVLDFLLHGGLRITVDEVYLILLCHKCI